MLIVWKALVDTAEGRETLSGQVPFDWNSSVHISAPLPEGVIVSVTARIPLAALEYDRIFMNGYQTWTSCPEYGVRDRIWDLRRVPAATVRKYAFDRYGDYHFVPYPCREGVTHGFSWCYFRRRQDYRLLASLDETPGYTLFTYDAGLSSLRLERDCKGIRCGGEYPLFDLYAAWGGEEQVFDGWFAALGVKPLPAPPLRGYTSWYNRYENINEGTIRADLEGCKSLLSPGDLFQIDDGWEPAVGDWLEADPAKFPNGLKALSDEIHAAGFKAGLWLAPFVARCDSRLVREHPDWLLRVDGQPWLLGSNWGGFVSLDIDNPAVTDYLRRVFDRVVREWGFDLLKLDFLYGAAPFGTERETRAGRMIRAMGLLRKLCGSAVLLGCGVPVMPAFGRVEYCRVSCDVGLNWDDKPFMRLCHRERVSTKQAILNTLFRRELNGRAYLSDPDVFFLRRDNIELRDDQKLLLARINALFGGVLLLSDDSGGYTEKERGLYRELLALTRAQNVRFDADNFMISFVLDGEAYSLPVPKELFE